MRELFDKIIGVTTILGGIYGLIFFYYIIPRILENPEVKNKERLELCQRKYGKTVKIIGPFIILYGILMSLGIL